jgi:ketosteroid isomerase-like protein
MIGSDLEGADLESRVASWADVAGVVSQCTGNAAVMQPELETVVGSQQLTATYDAAFENMRLDFTFRFDDITIKGDLAAVRATSQGTITIRATGETQPARLRQLFVLERTGPLEDHAVHVPADAGAVRRGLLRHLASPPPGFGHVPHPLAVAEHDAAPTTPTSTCPYRGRAGRRRRSRPCACSWGAGAAGGHGSRPPMRYLLWDATHGTP